jgi:predicted dehydrogenase
MRCTIAFIIAMSLKALADTNAPVHLMTFEPAHFHAALIQKEMQPDVAVRVDVYAQSGDDLNAHLKRIEQFNARGENPTRWQEIVHTNGKPLVQMLAEKPGNVVVVSGKNCGKIDVLGKVVGAKLNVLCDKPWIIEPEDFSKLKTTLDAADVNGVIAYDGMTQRFEVSCQLPRELVNDKAVFGKLERGSEVRPAVEMESVHYLLKEVAGMPLLRPAWYFDISQQGEALADIGTHLVDLVQWTLFPEQSIQYKTDIKLFSANRWPTEISLAQFQRITGEKAFPDYLYKSIHDGSLEYFANDILTYQLRGTFVKLTVKWGYEAPDGGKDSEAASFQGTKSRVEVRQGKQEKYLPVIYVIPNKPELNAEIEAALKSKVVTMQRNYPGLALKSHGDEFELVIPDALRIGHEAHFALLARRFLDYVHDPKSLPSWEKPNMLAKYYTTTEGVKLARQIIRQQP